MTSLAFGLFVWFASIHMILADQFGFSHRKLQISLFDSLPVHTYGSLQIYQLLNWQNNDKTINKINSDQAFTFTASHNQFSFMSQSEIVSSYLTVNIDKTPIVIPPATSPAPRISLPQVTTLFAASPTTSTQNLVSIDWRSQRVISAVKNQGSCGACWAFAAVAQLQTYLAMYSFINITLSQQQLIDCSNPYGNIGCGGGMMDNAFRYVVDYGITLEQNYPFQSKSGNSCQYSKNTAIFLIKQSKIIVKDCSSLVQTLSTRPVTVVVSVDINFLFYRNGLLNVCGNNINHALQLVGYHKDVNSAYYIGKNSWGTSWGEQGFIYIDANAQNGNLCSVCQYPQYPL